MKVRLSHRKRWFVAQLQFL